MLAASAGIGGAVLAMAASNPGPADFESFAADQLVELAVAEVCRPDGMPTPFKLFVENCPELMRSQRKVLGALAWKHTRRENFGLFSLYRTSIGGPQLLPILALPEYKVLTLAGAGHFVILSTSSGREPLESVGGGEP